MKILFLGKYNPTENLTGPEKVAKRILAGMSKENETVFIEYFFDGRKFGLSKKLFGKESIPAPDGHKIFRMGLFSLLVYLFNFNPDIVHLITYERFYVTSFVFKIFNKAKFIYNVHGIIAHENKLYKKAGSYYARKKDKFCEKIYLKYSDKLVFLSDRSVNIAFKFYKFDEEKINFLPNGIDKIFHSTGLDRQFEDHDILNLVFTGNIYRKEKGFEFLKNALNKLDIPFEIFLVSNPNIKVGGKFTTVPHMETDSYAEFLKDKDVFISASEYEPFSISAAEAMAAGVVPVVTHQTGMSRYIRNGENGYVFEYGNIKDLVNILIEINKNKNLLKEVSMNSVKIYDQLDWDKVCAMYDNLYTKTLTHN